MSEITNGSTNLSPHEIHVRQLETELASRERLTKAAESEIARVWEAYGKITKLSGVFLILAAAACTFLGFRTLSSIRASANDAARGEVDKIRGQIKAELDRQFSSDQMHMLIVEAARTNIDRQFAQDEVKKFIADAARERIDKTSPAIIYAAVSSNFLVYVQTATNGIDAVIAKSAYPQPAKESFSASDSNRVTILRFGNGASQIFLRLNGVPLESSIQVTASGHGQQFPVGYWRSISNVTFTYFAQGGDPSELQFEAHYIMDIHQTNAIQRVEVRGNKVFMDGNWVRFLQNGDTP